MMNNPTTASELAVRAIYTLNAHKIVSKARIQTAVDCASKGKDITPEVKVEAFRLVIETLGPVTLTQ